MGQTGDINAALSSLMIFKAIGLNRIYLITISGIRRGPKQSPGVLQSVVFR